MRYINENQPNSMFFPAADVNKLSMDTQYSFPRAHALPAKPPLASNQNTLNTFQTAHSTQFLDTTAAQRSQAYTRDDSSTEDLKLAASVLLWKRPWESLAALSVVVCTCLAAMIAHSALSNASPILVMGRLMLVVLAFNFIVGMINVNWQRKLHWHGSYLVKSVSQQLVKGTELFAYLHDKYLSSSDPTCTLKVALVLWAVCCAASFASFPVVVGMFITAAFTLPWLLDRHASLVKASYEKCQGMYKKLGLTRAATMMLLLVVLVAAFYTVSWANIAVSMLVLMIAFRCHLHQHEVEAFQDAAQPYAQSVKKASKAFTHVATEYITRMTPTAAKVRARVG